MNRIQSVDALRSIAIFAVIAIHTTPFKIQSLPNGDSLNLAIIINQMARFAVPFFFVVSGYFWAKKFNNFEEIFAPTVAMAKRIGFIFFAWSVIYLLPWNIYDSLVHGPTGPVKVFYQNLCYAFSNPLTIAMQGTKGHLWFLVGLLCSLSISALLIRMRLTSLLIALAVTLYAIGLTGKAYRDSPLGIHVSFNFRDGPFFALIFFVTGYLLQRKKPNDSWFSIGLLISIVGVALHFSELLLLKQNWGTTMAQDYVIGTYIFGTGVAMMALSNSNLLTFNCAKSIGPLVLGIYASHFIFVDLLLPVDRAFSAYATWTISYPVMVFLLSYALALLLSRFPLTKKLVA